MARTLTITTDGQVRINDWPGDGQWADPGS